MTAFLSILKRCFPDVDITLPAFVHNKISDPLINKDFISYAFINSMDYNLNRKIKTKFESLHDSVGSNIFITDNTKQKHIDIFSKAQRGYYAFCHLARMYKMKNALRYNMNTDLCMTPLSSFKASIKLDIYDDNLKTIYFFRLSDLINIINTSLSNSPEFFAEPLPIKNPYTNMHFTYAQLYTIYFKIRSSDMIMPILFHQYFVNNFNISKFCNFNECYIRDVAIKNYSKNSSEEQQYNYIMKMLRENKTSMPGIAIHPSFKRKYIIRAFSKYLQDYLLITYTLNPTLRYITRESLRQRLIHFSRLNPTFGRKIYYNIKRNSENTRNIPYQFRFDSGTTAFFNNNNNNNNNHPTINFTGEIGSLSYSIRQEISNIVSHMDVHNIPATIGIYYITNVNESSEPDPSIPISNRGVIELMINNDPLQNIHGFGDETDYSEASDYDDDENDDDNDDNNDNDDDNDNNDDNNNDDNNDNNDEDDDDNNDNNDEDDDDCYDGNAAPCDTVVTSIPTYNITMPEIQNMIVFNEESLAYISDTAPPPPPPPHNYLEPLTQQQISSEIFRMAIGNDNDGVDAQPEDAGVNSIQSSVTIDASNIIIVSANGTNYSIARV